MSFCLSNFLPQEILMVRHLRKKMAVLGLVVYWPAFFLLAHIPLPRAIQQVDVSDKTLHFLAYFVLAFLAWLVVNPYKCVDWRRLTVWLVLGGVACHGVLDEWLQGYVQGRYSDVWDFAADMAGAVASLMLLTLCSLWPAMLVLAGAVIMLLPNWAAVSVSTLTPMACSSILFLSYACFTGFWAACMHRMANTAHLQQSRHAATLRIGSIPWLIFVIAMPVALMCLTLLVSSLRNRLLDRQDILISIAGIVSVVILVLVGSLTGRDAALRYQ
jgi:VanZ family protein